MDPSEKILAHSDRLASFKHRDDTRQLGKWTQSRSRTGTARLARKLVAADRLWAGGKSPIRQQDIDDFPLEAVLVRPKRRRDRSVQFPPRGVGHFAMR